MFTKYLLPVVALGLIVFAALHVGGAAKEVSHTKPPVEPSHTPFPQAVAGAGMVEPQTQNIAIGSQVPGVVVKVEVEVGQRVKAGEPLFQLDDRVQQAELRARQATAAAAEAQLTQMQRRPRPEEVPAAEAQVTEMEANLVARRDSLERARRLSANRVLTDEDVVSREQEYQKAEAQLARMRAQLKLLKAGTWQYDLLVQQASLEEALSQVEQTKAEIAQRTVRALVDGQVLQVNVRPGEFVAAPANQALVILGDIDCLHVRVDIDEHDIHRLLPGAPAIATLRGRPETQFPLSFVRDEPYVVPKRSLTGDNTERVDTRVLQLIYRIDSKDERLYVGQQLDVYIDISGKEPSERPSVDDGSTRQ
ncbi:MAG TPA: HlyD family efflux transporter periplasmic adaptor subunit [Pirellulales bacterium]|nr:HlyD family efflux transporter periplasmic adaptor subunit [Pirellulales bacterium]